MKLSSCIATAVVIFYVSGIGSAAVIHVPGDQPTIQAGIDAAVDGDTVLVADGTYTGAGNKNLTWNGDVKHITVKSENGPDNCVIDCENSGRGFKFDETNQDDTDVVNGFTIQNGYVTGGWSEGAGGGIWCYRSSPAITGCTITDNSAEYGGGGIGCIESTPTITGCTITENSTEDEGGGIFCDDCSSSYAITGCTITENSAYEGGGIFCDSSSPTITDCTISGNSAYDYGGITCHSTSSPMITGCTISGNSAEHRGGGIGCSTSSPTITGCTISGNSAEHRGGGFYCKYSSPTITDCTIWENSTEQRGGGIYCEYNSPAITGCTITENSANHGGGIYCYLSSPATTDCTISGNSADNGGGGIYCSRSSPAITGCTISGNSAVDDGGGINCFSSTPAIIGCTISGNSTGAGGGGIRCCCYSSPAITGCTITQNSAEYGGGIYCYDFSSPEMTDCVLWNDTAGGDGDEIYLFSTSILTISYSDVQGGQEAAHAEPDCTLNWGDGMIDEDPLFVIGPEGDFYLSQTAAGQAENSPCVDTGSDSASNICFEGPDGEICMDELWTRTDEIADTGQVDMGYHYGIESFFSTPTPVSSHAPTMPPTQTPVSTYAPTMPPTQTPVSTHAPTMPPTQTPVSTHVPTMSHTQTPVSTHTPTMPPTQTVIPGIAVDLRLSKTTFTPGDLFLLNAYISNSGPQTYTQQPFAVLLYVYGIYFWHPNWTEEFDYEGIDLGIGSPAFTEEILRFNWPEESCLGSAICYGALLNESCSEILGDWDFIEFEWMP